MSHDNPAADHASIDNDESPEAIEQHLKSKSTWLRLVFMVAFIIIANLAAMVASVVVLLSFLWVLFTGQTNGQLQQAGRALAAYFADIVRFLTYNTDEKPYPFGADWPASDDD